MPKEKLSGSILLYLDGITNAVEALTYLDEPDVGPNPKNAALQHIAGMAPYIFHKSTANQFY